MTFLEFLLAAALAFSLWKNVQAYERRLEDLEDRVDELTTAWAEFDDEDDGPDGGERVPRPQAEIRELRKAS
jgi:HAMP domain-containing protein